MTTRKKPARELLKLPAPEAVPDELRLLLRRAEDGDWQSRFAFAMELISTTQPFRNRHLAVQLFQEVAEKCKDRAITMSFIAALVGLRNQRREKCRSERESSWINVLQGIIGRMAQTCIARVDLKNPSEVATATRVLRQCGEVEQLRDIANNIARGFLPSFDVRRPDHRGLAAGLLTYLRGPTWEGRLAGVCDGWVRWAGPRVEPPGPGQSSRPPNATRIGPTVRIWLEASHMPILMKSVASVPDSFLPFWAKHLIRHRPSMMEYLRGLNRDQRICLAIWRAARDARDNDLTLAAFEGICATSKGPVSDAAATSEMVKFGIAMRRPELLPEYAATLSSPMAVSSYVESARRAQNVDMSIQMLSLSTPSSLPARSLRMGLTYLEAGRPMQAQSRWLQSDLAAALPIERANLLWCSFGSIDPQQFHVECDGKGPTLVIIETTDGEVFGGYSPIPWSSHGEFVRDETQKAFLFVLQSSRAERSRILKVVKPERAVYHNERYGPCFGTELRLSEDGCEVGRLKVYGGGGSDAPTYLLSTSEFTIRSIEVWRVLTAGDDRGE